MDDLDKQIINAFQELPAEQKIQFILSIPELLKKYDEERTKTQ